MFLPLTILSACWKSEVTSFKLTGQFQLKYLPGHRIYISDSSRVGDGHLCFTEERNIDELNRYQNKIFCYSAGKYITYFHPTQDFEISLCEFEVYGKFLYA